jgi:polyvinyl alcohol dehydrogenase (cytochrome)
MGDVRCLVLRVRGEAQPGRVRRGTWRRSRALLAAAAVALLCCLSTACAATGTSSTSTATPLVASSPSISPAATPVASTSPGSTSQGSDTKVTPSNWTTYHGNAEASGLGAATSSVRSASKAWTSAALDGEIYGEPLVANGRVYAATENDTVYAIAADSGKVLWSRHLATPVPAGDLPCGDISPTVGITGTPVIDLARSEIFVDADTKVSGPAASHGVEASHRLYGLNLLTGKTELDQAALPNAGEDQLAQLQRPGLALDDGRVIIAYGQNSGDCPGVNGPGHGFVVSIPEQGGKLSYFQIARGSDRGAVWMGGSSPVIDPKGNVYVASADGYDQGAGQAYDDSDAVIELSPTMQQESIFYPRAWQTLSAEDKDLGTGDPALVDGYVFQIGKTDTAYLLRQGHLGGEEGEVSSLSVCSGDPDGGHAVDGSIVFIPCPNGVTAVQVSARAPHLKVLWTDSDGADGAPIIADGLIWTIGDGDAIDGLDPANGKEVVSVPYSGSANHFPTPTIADGLLLVPGMNQVIAFKGPAGLPPAPTT